MRGREKRIGNGRWRILEREKNRRTDGDKDISQILLLLLLFFYQKSQIFLIRINSSVFVPDIAVSFRLLRS
jgi:hypothetical protein